MSVIETKPSEAILPPSFLRYKKNGLFAFSASSSTKTGIFTKDGLNSSITTKASFIV